VTSLVTLLHEFTAIKTWCFRYNWKTKTSDVNTWHRNNKDLLSSLCRKIKIIHL